MCLGLCAGFRDLELRCEDKDQNLKYEQQESTAKKHMLQCLTTVLLKHISESLKKTEC
jgi:hypothetical protein